MKDTYTRILELELQGSTPKEIQDTLKLSESAVRNHRNKPQYTIDLEEARRERSKRKEMSLQSRAESLVERLIEALEDSFDRAQTVEDMVKYTANLKEVVLLVGKPEQNKGETGVLVVPELLTTESFNDLGSNDNVKEAPKEILLREPDSLALSVPTEPSAKTHDVGLRHGSGEIYSDKYASKIESLEDDEEWPDPLEEEF